MIDFACKRFSLDEVIRCGLSLTKTDLAIMEFLLKEDSLLTTEQISKAVGVNLSTSQRAVKKLFEKGVINRFQENLSAGGYIYKYRPKPKKEVRKIIMGIVSTWTKTVENQLDRW